MVCYKYGLGVYSGATAASCSGGDLVTPKSDVGKVVNERTGARHVRLACCSVVHSFRGGCVRSFTSEQSDWLCVGLAR